MKRNIKKGCYEFLAIAMFIVAIGLVIAGGEAEKANFAMLVAIYMLIRLHLTGEEAIK